MGLVCFCPFSVQRRWQLLFCAVLSRMVVGTQSGRIEIVSYFSRADLFPDKGKKPSLLLGQSLGRWASGPLIRLGLSLTQDSSAGTQAHPVSGIPLDPPLCCPAPWETRGGG